MAKVNGLPIPRARVAGAVIIALALLPVVSSIAGQPFYVTLMSRMMIYGLAALGLNLILGYGGMVSFGHALYIGIGAYAVGILSFHGIGNGYAHVGIALATGLLLSSLIGLVCLRASGVAFIMITLAFAQMSFFLAVGLKTYGGDDGFGLSSRSDFGFVDINNNVVLYYLVFVVLMVTLLLFSRLVQSRFGMTLRGCRQNERRMRAMGFPTLKYKLLAYVISAQVCVLAGVLLANLTKFVSPSYMQWTASGEILLMAVLGGVGTLLGPIVGAIAWLALEYVLSSVSLGLPWGIDEFVHTHWMLLLGVFVIFVASGLKQGLYGVLVEREEAVR